MSDQTVGKWCKPCAPPGAVDVHSKRCTADGCNVHVSRNKYDGLCLMHFIHAHPDRALVSVRKNFHTKELNVFAFLKQSFGNRCTIHFNQTPPGSCSRRKVDAVIDVGYCVLAIEIDELQHATYSAECEMKRLHELWSAYGGRHMYVIRFNPDQYKNANGKSVPSCWTYNKDGFVKVKKKSETEWHERLEALRREVLYVLENEAAVTTAGADRPYTVRTLFYNDLSF
jgi:hypothetical protein